MAFWLPPGSLAGAHFTEVAVAEMLANLNLLSKKELEEIKLRRVRPLRGLRQKRQ